MKESSLRCCVVGAGYVGLVTGSCLARYHNVTLVESDDAKLKTLRRKRIPFHEPGLSELLQESSVQNHLSFTNSLSEALHKNPHVIFICVGTPSLADGNADLSAVYSVAQNIGTHVQNDCLVVNKSTVPIGTAQRVLDIICNQTNHNVTVASNPEFLRQGTAVTDFLNPDRIVVGVDSESSKTLLFQIYQPFLQNHEQWIVMDIASAELCKYAANAMLASRISFMNELARLADVVGADINQISRGIGKDPRIGSLFLKAGIGYGGSCFPKDVKALAYMGKQNNLTMPLTRAIDDVNNTQLDWFFSKLLHHYQGSLRNKHIGIWGLSFKPDTDDTRSSSAINLIEKCLEYGAHVIAYDPIVSMHVKHLDITLAPHAHEVLHSSHCLVVLTEWQEFLTIKPQEFLALKDQIIFDGRNCLNSARLAECGLRYHGIAHSVSRQPIQKGSQEN
ncbi:UDP-glucose/GDP-mannose dehydrogenase family protein [Candidatus Babeliales bacterium]|nr:UDP-glucose/GDP-mannose dehydrogenase family protein [Candidatus Babeliales bacterium]